MERKTRSDKLGIVRFLRVGLTPKDIENLEVIRTKFQIRSFTDAFRFVLNQAAEKVRSEENLK